MAYTTIDDPSAHFQTATYTGNSSTQTITNDGNSDLQPDLIWIKARSSSTYNHALQDTSRGLNLVLGSNTSNADGDVGNNVTSVNSDGFALGDWGHTNYNSVTYVAWQWKVNGGTTTNQTGANINSVTQANTTAGVSIVTYTGNGGAGQSVKHGLGTTPQMFMIKRRDGTGDWFVYHQAMGNTKHLHLNTDAAESATSDFGNYGPDATSFFVNNTGTCVNNETYVAYCFADVKGYSRFGRYAGNASADGPFIYTGFKPALVIIKVTSNSGYNWWLTDNKRNPQNEMDKWIFPDLANAEYNGAGASKDIDFLSNGFKLRSSDDGFNGTGKTYVYFAWAENPFVTSEGIPTTAR